MGIVISASTVMTRAYSGNTGFKDQNFRQNRTNHEVVNADRRAMARALERLENLDFSSKEEDDTKSIYNTLTSYLDIYNNAITSTGDSETSQIRRTAREMKKLMKEHGDELEAMGISIKSNGTVRIDKDELKKATTRQVSKVFGNSEYIGDMKKLMRRLRNQVNREVPKAQEQSEPVKSDTLTSETAGRNLNLYV